MEPEDVPELDLAIIKRRVFLCLTGLFILGLSLLALGLLYQPFWPPR